ncbi:MAG: glycoside hydrolase family 66 protein [Sumerlaeia bacterium]
MSFMNTRLTSSLARSRPLLTTLLATVFLLLFTASVAAAPLITDVYTVKAQYKTWETVQVKVHLKNTTGSWWSGNIGVYPRHLGRNLNKDQHQYVSFGNGSSKTLTFNFSMGSANHRGYLAEVWCWKDSGGATDVSSTSFDVSNDWTKFPRYGYLTEFHDNVNVNDLIGKMRKYKINGIQYYDWADEHHIQYFPGFQYWQDIARRDPWVSKAKIQELISKGHSYNMTAMAYQLMFGAYDEYWNDGVQVSWGAFTHWQSGTYDPSDQDYHPLNIPGWETNKIYLFNIRHQGWRDWMADDFNHVFANFDFDGWHIDTLGSRGTLYDWNKNTLHYDQEYPAFINNIRDQVGHDKDYVVNTVSNYGESQVAQNAQVDFIYSELWGEGDENDFYDLKQILTANQGRTAKNMVIAGYMNYERSKNYSGGSPGTFKEASILLADAVIFACGGWHIELGDGEHLLSNEYFPNKNLVMSSSLKSQLRRYYDFAVAYENLLRDNVYDGNKRVDFDLGGVASGYDGTKNRVWKLAKWRDGYDGVNYYDIAHFINLRSCNHTTWRDPYGDFNPPATLTNKEVRLYYDNDWGSSKVWYASPDFDSGKAVEVTNYTRHWDSNEGKWYVKFTLPQYKYWTMVWLERHF